MDSDEGTDQLDMLPETEGFINSLDRIFKDNEARVETVKGNLLIHVFGVVTRMYVTSGPNKGAHEDATDDPVHYTLALSQWVLQKLLDPEEKVDLEEAEADGCFHMEGDQAVYQRFTSLGKSKNLLSIRFSS